jgi:hypothetical protein
MKIARILAIALTTISLSSTADVRDEFTDEENYRLGAEQLVDQAKAFRAFCREAAPDPRNDWDAIVQKFETFKNLEFGTAQVAEARRAEATKMKTEGLAALDAMVLQPMKKEGSASPFCRTTYLRWLGLDRAQYKKTIVEGLAEYKVKRKAYLDRAHR